MKVDFLAVDEKIGLASLEIINYFIYCSLDKQEDEFSHR